MAKEKEKDDDIDVVEETPGDEEVLVEDDKQGKKANEDDKGEKLAGEEDDKTGKARAGDVSVEVDAEDPEREAIRAKRREERRRQKEARDKQAEMLEQLARENAMLRESLGHGEQRIASIEQRAVASDLAQIESAMEQAKIQAEQARELIIKGVAEQKGEAVADAQIVLGRAERAYEHYARVRENLIRAARSPAPADPRVLSLANEWRKRNSWYDPASDDEDNQIARIVDRKIAAEGWNPRTPAFWAELDKRLKARLPHRYKDVSSGDGEDDDDDVRTITGGSSRESAGRVTYKLSAARVAALKEAGVWDDPAERAKHIRRYMQYDKEQQRG
jgi:hypothetical protein